MVREGETETEHSVIENGVIKKMIILICRFPLAVCREKHQLMDPEYKKSLQSKLLKFADEFNISDFTLVSFSRQYGMQKTLSASDVVYSLDALLLGPDEDWLPRFFKALDALDNIALVTEGIEMAKECQKAVIQQGQSLIVNQRITRLKGFFLVVLNQQDSVSHWFQYPRVLLSLGRFITEALQVSNSLFILNLQGIGKDCGFSICNCISPIKNISCSRAFGITKVRGFKEKVNEKEFNLMQVPLATHLESLQKISKWI